MVVLPAPFSPTKAIFSPDFTVKLNFLKIFRFVSGYLKETFLNSIMAGSGVCGIDNGFSGELIIFGVFMNSKYLSMYLFLADMLEYILKISSAPSVKFKDC
ncbi:MAG: hypothetical protein ACD_24C00201G0001 [uncultured bacterium]|nr:MAG: hypothetical protein ACD_24C00201G0001 [uncultured bacterium]